MRKAIEKAIYYLDVSNFNPNITFEYSDEETFKNIIKDLSNNIDVIATFGKKDNICYSIFDQLYKSNVYKDLLFDKTTSIYIINRKDITICINRITDETQKQRIAVIKIDSVLSEYSPKSIKHYIFYPIVFIVGISIPLLIKND